MTGEEEKVHTVKRRQFPGSRQVGDRLEEFSRVSFIYLGLGHKVGCRLLELAFRGKEKSEDGIHSTSD